MEQVERKLTSRHSGGFSLIEILAVLAIMSFVATIVVLNVPAGRSETQRDATAFATLLEQAIQYSLFTAAPLRLEFHAGKYQVSEFKRGEWRSFQPALSQYQAGSPVNLIKRPEKTLYDNERIVSGIPQANASAEYILIDSVAGVEPFTASFGIKRPTTVTVDQSGAITVNAP